MKFWKASVVSISMPKYELRRTTGNTRVVQGHAIYDTVWHNYRFEPSEGFSFDAADLEEISSFLRKLNNCR